MKNRYYIPLLGGLSLLLAYTGFLAFQSCGAKRLSAQTIPQLGQPIYLEMGTVYTVTSNSMEPAFMLGDWVVMTPGKTAPRVGQVVVFYDIIPQNIFVHRVIKVGIDDKGWWATTKGDNASEVDWQPLRETNLLGVVKWRMQLYR